MTALRDDLFGPPASPIDAPFPVVSPFLEMGAYEAMWTEAGVSFKVMADRFAEHPDWLPSSFVPADKAHEYARSVLDRMEAVGIGRFGVRVHGAAEYPTRLRDAQNPVELVYYAGHWDLVWCRSVAVVGSRKPSHDGLARARKVTEALVADGFTVVSGLAAGIDTMVHESALAAGGRTMAVIGTPLSATYPRENAELQRRIADEFLVVSQVPVLRYEQQDYRYNRGFFPERNVTMSALTEATIIVEAGQTSGTLTQARAALRQERRLFILDSCFRTGLD